MCIFSRSYLIKHPGGNNDYTSFRDEKSKTPAVS